MILNTNTEKAVELLKDKITIEDDYKGVMLFKDCVLMERYTGKSYAYTLFNYITGAKKYIGHCNKQADNMYLIKKLPLIMKQDFFNITFPKGEELIRYIFSFVFTSYGYVVRDEQIDLSVKMYRAMQNNELLMSDVAVGFGKTHAYLVAAIIFNLETQSNKRPIIVSTSSKELQKAITYEYIPDISKMLLEHGIIDDEIAVVLRKGKNNYVCAKRLKEYLISIDPAKKILRQLMALKRLKASDNIDLDNAQGITAYDKRRICVNLQECRTCNYQCCKYRSFMKKALKNEFILQVCNHNYYTMDAKNKSLKRKPLLPEYKAVIIDEAHKLDQAAMQTYCTKIDFQELHNMVIQCIPSNIQAKNLKKLFRHCKSFVGINKKLVKDLLNQIEINDDTSKYTIKIKSEILGEIRGLKTVLTKIQETLPNKKRANAKLIGIHISNIDTFIKSDVITFLEITNKGCVLFGVPKNISSLIKNDLFSSNHSVIMTSGTLAVDDDFEYVKQLLGLNKTACRMSYLVKQSPFDYKENSLIYTSNKTIYPDYENELYIKTLAAEINRLIKASYGHALILFTSYEPMRKVHMILKSHNYQFPLFAQKKNNNRAIIDFKNSKNAVLLGCGSLWEGMNFQGDMLSHLIITKLPFLIPDPITEHKRSEMSGDDEYRQQILLPQMLLKLKQGHGRAIRTDTDTAVISILDSRMNTTYKQSVLEALPECETTSDIEDVKQFFRDRKTGDYWRINYDKQL